MHIVHTQSGNIHDQDHMQGLLSFNHNTQKHVGADLNSVTVLWCLASVRVCEYSNKENTLSLTYATAK